MPLTFTKDQIRRYLLEMGYGGLDDQHLELFMRDLKKLIRHEDKLRRTRKTQFPESNNSDAIPITSVSDDSARSFNDSNNHTPRPSAQSDTSTIYKKAPHVPTEMERPKSTPRITIVPGKSPSQVRKPGPFLPPTTFTAGSAIEGMGQQISTSSSSEETSSSSSSCVSICPDSSKERIRFSKYTGKSDPVARYHYYKSLWDKQRAPGEDRHMQLRWNIRAGTMGRVPCDPEGIHINYLR